MEYFFVVNCIGTIIFIIVDIACGILFHSILGSLLKEVELLRHSIFIIFMVVITIVVFLNLKETQKRNKSLFSSGKGELAFVVYDSE
ncbi:hypothetical protein ACM55K_11685 [Flavobacterium sp. LT1R49]|uniref:hypothetical protein n=1 Tax=Flavobacterium arabinosi TaxID=3398737 RepID=UPI003A85E152